LGPSRGHTFAYAHLTIPGFRPVRRIYAFSRGVCGRRVHFLLADAADSHHQSRNGRISAATHDGRDRRAVGAACFIGVGRGLCNDPPNPRDRGKQGRGDKERGQGGRETGGSAARQSAAGPGLGLHCWPVKRFRFSPLVLIGCNSRLPVHLSSRRSAEQTARRLCGDDLPVRRSAMCSQRASENWRATSEYAIAADFAPFAVGARSRRLTAQVGVSRSEARILVRQFLTTVRCGLTWRCDPVVQRQGPGTLLRDGRRAPAQRAEYQTDRQHFARA
jgi:hypothetical protein